MFKIILASLFAFFAALNLCEATQVSLREMVLTRLSRSQFKVAVDLKNTDGDFVRLDCLDKRQPTNTVLFVTSQEFPFSMGHETFTGTNDFYCSGMRNILLRDLKVGYPVEVAFEYDQGTADEANERYNQIIIHDVLFKFSNETKWRSLKKNAGTVINFVSTEPLK